MDENVQFEWPLPIVGHADDVVLIQEKSLPEFAQLLVVLGQRGHGPEVLQPDAAA